MNRSFLFLSVLLIFAVASCAPAAEEAETGAAVGDAPMADDQAASDDPLTGAWSGSWGPSAEHRNDVTLELTWDGSALSGTVNPGEEAIALDTATFDPATGDITMEANATNFRGEEVHYMIEGQVAGSTMTGAWTHAGGEGDFTLTKQ